MPWSIVQSQSAASSAVVGTLSATFGSAVSTSNVVMVQVATLIGSNTVTITVTDGASNTYTSAAAIALNNGGSDYVHHYLFAIPTTSAALTVTVTPNINAYIAMTISEWGTTRGR